MTGKLVEDFSHNDLEGVYTPYNDNPVNFEPFEIQSTVVRESTPTLLFEHGHTSTRLILADDAALPSDHVPSAGSVTRLWFRLGGIGGKTWLGYVFGHVAGPHQSGSESYIFNVRYNRILLQVWSDSGVEEDVTTVTSIPTGEWHYADIYWFVDEPSLGFTDDEIAAAVYNGSTDALIDTAAIAPSEPYQYSEGGIGFKTASDMEHDSYIDVLTDISPSTDVDFAGHATATSDVSGDLSTARGLSTDAIGVATVSGALDRVPGVAGELAGHATAVTTASGTLAPLDREFHLFETFDYVTLDEAFEGFTHAFQLNTATVHDGIHSLRAREDIGGTQTIYTTANTNATGYAPRQGTIVRFWLHLGGDGQSTWARYSFAVHGGGIIQDPGGGYQASIRADRVAINVWNNGSVEHYLETALDVPTEQWNYADVYWFVENGVADFTDEDIGVIVYDGETNEQIGSVKATPSTIHTGGGYGSWNSGFQEYSTYIDALSTNEPFEIDRINLAGEAAASADASGALAVRAPRDLEGAASAAGSLTGAVDVEPLITFGAVASAVGAASGALTVEPWPYIDIAGTANATGAAVGGMTRVVSLSSVDPWDDASRPRATGTARGSLFITQPHVSTFVGTARAAASLDADLDVFRRLDGAASAHALATGAFHTKQTLAGVATATGGATARLFRPATQIGRLDLRLGGLDYQAPVYDPWTIDPSWLRVRLSDGGVGALSIVDPDVQKLRVRRDGSVYGVAMTADFLRGRFIARSSAEASITRVEHTPVAEGGYGRSYGRRYGSRPITYFDGTVAASAEASADIALGFALEGRGEGIASASAALDPTTVTDLQTGYGRTYGRLYGSGVGTLDDFTTLDHWSSENDPATDGYSLDTSVYVTEGSSLHRAAETGAPLITDNPPGGFPEPPYRITFDARFSQTSDGRIHYLIWIDGPTFSGADFMFIRINQSGGSLEIREPGTIHAQEWFSRTANMWYTCSVNVEASSEPGMDWHIETTLYDDSNTELVTASADVDSDYPENYYVGYDIQDSTSDMYVDNWRREA